MSRFKWNIFCILLVLVSCSTAEQEQNVMQIEYGTSFGECLGYCKFVVIIQPAQLSYTQSGWVDTLEAITCSDDLDPATWTLFENVVDEQVFMGLPETIGCPDCADGGAEWVEIDFMNGKKHKVTFEYQNEPQELQHLVSKAREQKEKFIDCLIID